MGYCNKKNKCGCGIDFAPIPASLGDDKGPLAPKNGTYQDTLVRYEANGNIYLYTHDGVFVPMPYVEYSEFVGTNGSNSGKKGLVPAPTAADAGKFLKADGTWAEVEEGGGAVKSVNGQTGDVVLTAEDVGALSNDPSTLQPYVKRTELSPVSFSGNYDDLINEPEDFSQEDWDQLWQTY